MANVLSRLKAAYSIVRRYELLARGEGLRSVRPKRAAQSRRNPGPDAAETRERERQEVLEVRQHLYEAFVYAHGRNQVDTAVSLLKSGVAPEKLETVLASMPAGRRGGNLYQRMEAVPRPDVGLMPPPGPPPGSPKAMAAHITAAYEKAIGPK